MEKRKKQSKEELLEKYISDLSSGKASRIPADSKKDESFLELLKTARCFVFFKKRIAPRRSFVNSLRKEINQEAKSMAKKEGQSFWSFFSSSPVLKTGYALSVVIFAVFIGLTAITFSDPEDNTLVVLKDTFIPQELTVFKGENQKDKKDEADVKVALSHEKGAEEPGPDLTKEDEELGQAAAAEDPGQKDDQPAVEDLPAEGEKESDIGKDAKDAEEPGPEEIDKEAEEPDEIENTDEPDKEETDLTRLAGILILLNESVNELDADPLFATVSASSDEFAEDLLFSSNPDLDLFADELLEIEFE